MVGGATPPGSSTLPVYTRCLAVSKMIFAASKKSQGDWLCRVDPGGGCSATRIVSKYWLNATASYVSSALCGISHHELLAI